MTSSDPLLRLVAAASEGDDVAVAHLVRATQPAVWRLCSALGSPGEEEDLVQETYLRALRALPSYRGDADFVVWLLSIARRVCADHVRRRQRQRRLMDRLSRHVEPESATAPESTVHFAGELVGELAPERREAFVLTQLVGLSYAEAAAVVGCPVGTIRSRVSRARADLIQAMARADTG